MGKIVEVYKKFCFGCTGQRNYSYINLLDYGARWYSPSLGRFTQPDSIVPDLTFSQDWNRYAYVRNNPVNYTDPSGHTPVWDDCSLNGRCTDTGTGGGGNQPGNLDEDVVVGVCGSNPLNPAESPICTDEENWSFNNFANVADHNIQIGTGNSKVEQLENAKNLVIPDGASVIIIGYSAGADTAIFYADLLIGLGVDVSSLVLLGPTYTWPTCYDGVSSASCWDTFAELLTNINESGTNILNFDDAGEGGEEPSIYDYQNPGPGNFTNWTNHEFGHWGPVGPNGDWPGPETNVSLDIRNRVELWISDPWNPDNWISP